MGSLILRNGVRMALEDLAGWTSRLRAAMGLLLDGFEARHGYTPGVNEIRERVTAFEGTALPSQVQRLFSAVDEVSLPDAWNGYFLGPADVVADRGERSLVAESDGEPKAHSVLLIGSDGGGNYFAVQQAEASRVIRICEPVDTSTEVRGLVREVAPDLDTFLESLIENVELSARGLEPPF
jgi:hypothetical protein